MKSGKPYAQGDFFIDVAIGTAMHCVFRSATRAIFAALVVFGSADLKVLAAKPDGDDPQTLRIGIADSFFRDLPESQVASARRMLSVLMKAQTGLASEMAVPAPATDLAQRLADKRLDFTLLQGVEFAWDKERHPELRALVILVNQHRYRRAHLLVRKEDTAQGWADLKNKVLAIPSKSREHCHLFLEYNCRRCGQEYDHFFARVTKPATVEDALDDLVDNHAQAAVVDEVALEAYGRRKPGRFAKLKDLQKSELFPDTVVAYRAGALTEATLRRCREGLVQADKHVQSRLLLMLWRASAFEPVPKDFERKLSEISKAYPRPAAAAVPETGKIPAGNRQ